MISVEVHGCGRVTYFSSAMGNRIRTETVPLEADQAVAALVGGEELYRVTFIGGRPSSFGSASPAVLAKLRTEPGERPLVVRAHRCTAAEAVQTPTPRQSVQPTPQRPSAGQQTPFSGPSAAPSSARSADRPRSEGPRCDDCGLIMDPGDYVAVQIGAIYVWAQHLTNCGG